MQETAVVICFHCVQKTPHCGHIQPHIHFMPAVGEAVMSIKSHLFICLCSTLIHITDQTRFTRKPYFCI